MLTDRVRSVRLAAAESLPGTLDLDSLAGLDFLQSLAVDADQPTSQFQAAMFLLSRQHPSEALTHLEKATAWDPLSPPFQCMRAQVLDELGQTDKALGILTSEESAMPNDPHVPYFRALILAQHSRYEEARTAANCALAVQPNFEPAKQLLQTMRLSRP